MCQVTLTLRFISANLPPHSHTLLQVELLFPRSQRTLFQLDGDVAPTRRIVMVLPDLPLSPSPLSHTLNAMQVPVDPFETESLASLFAKVGLDKTDVLLLGEEFSVTLKSLAEMPDEVSSVLAFLKPFRSQSLLI